MRTDNIYKSLLYVFLLILIICITVLLIIKENINVNRKYYKQHDRFSRYMVMKLEMEKHLPASGTKNDAKNATIIYVLGGNQDSLISRFRKASDLYHQGISSEILILKRPGITEYDLKLGRNLTNDEWAVKELEKLNVRREDIQSVAVKTGLFGTLSEATDLPVIVHEKGYKKLILITSAYHTRRTFSAFSKFATDSSLELYIYGSDDITGLHGLLLEYMKLFLYENIAFPVYGWKKRNILESNHMNYTSEWQVAMTSGTKGLPR